MKKLHTMATALVLSLLAFVNQVFRNSKNAIIATNGEGFVDTAVKILISVVIGALLLGGLYALFNTTVLPTLMQRIQDMFNFTAP